MGGVHLEEGSLACAGLLDLGPLSGDGGLKGCVDVSQALLVPLQCCAVLRCALSAQKMTHSQILSYSVILMTVTRSSCQKRQGASADKLQVRLPNAIPCWTRQIQQDPKHRGCSVLLIR
jgi:hypothetical protein